MNSNTLKRLLAMLLALSLLVALTACGSKKQDASDHEEEEAEKHEEKQNESVDFSDPQQVGVGSVPIGTFGELVGGMEEAVQTRWYPENYLMAQTGDAYNDPLFGNEAYVHETVTSVTFVDTLSGMNDTAWDVSADGNGTVMAWMENDTELYIGGEGGVTASDCYRLFSGFYNVLSIDFGDCFYTDIAENMSMMFQRCWVLPQLDVSFLNTSSAKQMRGMFVDCEELTTLDLSGFDTSNVVDMSDMFWYCLKLESVNLSSFDTSCVQAFDSMFGCCSSLVSVDVRHFDTSSAVDLSGMFYDCSTLTELDLSSFRTENVTNMQQMFMECSSLNALDLSSFHTENVVRFGSMFEFCENLETLDVSSFRTPKAERMNSMFANCPKLTVLDLGGFTFDAATMTQQMFYCSYALTQIGTQITVPEGCDTTDMYTGSGLV